MPFKSKAQRRKLWATRPDVAREYEKKTPKGATLPEKKRSKKKSSGKKKGGS